MPLGKLGEYAIKLVRSSVILTTSYVVGTVIANAERENQLMIYIKFTKGSLTSFQWKVEFSNDNGATWYQESATSVSSGTGTDSVLEHTTTNAGSYRFAIPIKDERIRISVKGTGTVTNSLCEVHAVLGTV